MGVNHENNPSEIQSPMEAVVDTKGECKTDLLEKVLARFWEKEAVHIKNAKTEPATSKGTNFTSDVWRVNFTYTVDDGKDPHTDCVVVKTRPSCEETRKLMHTKTAFTNEIFAYEHVIPALSFHVGVPLRVPQFYHGNDNSIVFEDMQKRSFKTINKKLAVEWNQVWSAIEEMAKLHAASIVMKKTAPEKFEALTNSIIRIPVEDTEPLGDRQRNALDTILKVLEESKTPEATKLIDMLKPISQNAWLRQKDIIDDEVPIRVINHGSVWINNLLYRNDMITLLDWQHIVYSSPAHDLSFFLYVNIDTDFLANKKQKLVDFYLSNLHQFIFDGCVNKITAEELNELLKPLTSEWINAELKRFSIYGFMMAQWITPVFYWSEAVFQTIAEKGGLENMSVEDRMKHMTSDQRDRMIKLTKLFAEESK
ncbi:uncharacterized protein LOC123306673 [Coccinella septempunctata]|uniref:uncharacterized protein LOC123306673 n=1 Tax=Coccinella septempunctata TaxID=41139 RepID=UPI001D076919|nr:uncharacterized protein LOC123306673 [Coccinella septempunctata]